MEIGTEDASNTESSSTLRRSISSSTLNGVHPGRVDSTPKSMTSAPS